MKHIPEVAGKNVRARSTFFIIVHLIYPAQLNSGLEYDIWFLSFLLPSYPFRPSPAPVDFVCLTYLPHSSCFSMFTDVLIVITPEFLSELVSLTSIFPFFSVSYYHQFPQNLSLVVLLSCSVIANITHTRALKHPHPRPSTTLPCSVFPVLTPVAPRCRSPPGRSQPAPGSLCPTSLFPHVTASSSIALAWSTLPVRVLPVQFKSCFPPLRKEEEAHIVVLLSSHWN